LNAVGDLESLQARKKIITLDDIVGPQPEDLRQTSAAWKELKNMVGLGSLKHEVERLFDLADANRQRWRDGKDSTQVTLNRCFLGKPGVGKTTAAALFGRIFADMGLLSKGKVIIKSPSDLLGQYVGASEAKTVEILDQARGNVLIIDDAHMMYQGDGHGTDRSDVFRTGIIDTLVANISGSPGEDRAVILCGYTDKMEEMFLHANPGLQRRFPLENAIKFEDYDDDQLCQILDRRMANDGITASVAARTVARDVLSKMRSRPRFGNGGDVEALLAKARLRQVQRLRDCAGESLSSKNQLLEAEDFDPDHDRSKRADANREELFRDFLGLESIVQNFRGYQKMADGMRLYDIDPRPHIPWAFIFKGPPGTGKTLVTLLPTPQTLFCANSHKDNGEEDWNVILRHGLSLL
jgi:SpoVK/Ycf46/Vps4 family AAA+-type ATPase